MSYQDRRNREDWGDDWFDWLKWLRCEALSLSLCTEEEEEVEFLFHLTNRWLPINAPRLLRIGSVSLVLFSLSSLSVLSTRRRRSRSDTEHWRCKGKLTSLLLFVRERARAWDDVSTLHWNTFLTTSQVELVRLLLLMMLLLLLQQQQQQVVNHQHMVFSVCCLFASLVSSFSFSFIERERETWYNTMQTFLPSNSWLINSSLSLTHSRSHMLLYESMRERRWARGALVLLLRGLLDDDDVLVVSTTTPTTRSSERREREQWVQESDLSLLVLLLLVLVFGTFLWLIRPTHCLLPCWLVALFRFETFQSRYWLSALSQVLLLLSHCVFSVSHYCSLLAETQLISPWHPRFGRCLMCSSWWWQAQRLALGMSMHGPIRTSDDMDQVPQRGGFGIGQRRRRRRHVRLWSFGCDCNSSRESRPRWWLVMIDDGMWVVDSIDIINEHHHHDDEHQRSTHPTSSSSSSAVSGTLGFSMIGGDHDDGNDISCVYVCGCVGLCVIDSVSVVALDTHHHHGHHHHHLFSRRLSHSFKSFIHSTWCWYHSHLSPIHDPWSTIHDPWSMIHDPWSMIHDPWSNHPPLPVHVGVYESECDVGRGSSWWSINDGVEVEEEVTTLKEMRERERERERESSSW